MTTHGVGCRSAWQRFWDRGGFWRALLLVAGYYALYQLGSLLFLPLLAQVSDPALRTVVGTALPIALGGVLLLAYGASLRRNRELFARQPVPGRGWMWIAVGAVLGFNVLRFAAIDYGAAGAATVLAWLLAGLCIGFAEEVLTRGWVVRLMRQAGHGEARVALASAGLFAAMHAGNLLSGQSLVATILQLLYTFAFGLCMYLALRVTGHLIWPILLHATTDPSIFLLTDYPTAGPLGTLAGLGNIVVIAVGLVLGCVVRGRASAGPLVRPAPGSDAAPNRVGA